MKPATTSNEARRRRAVAASFGSLLALLVVAACARDDRKPAVTPEALGGRPETSHGPAQYIVASPRVGKGPTLTIPLGNPVGANGVIADRRRIVVGQGEPRVAAETTEEPLVGGARLPTRLGAGFLFWTANELYRADAFDGRLAPITRLPDGIDTISFAPKSIVVHTHNGERWAFGLPKGERATFAPLGAADVQALDDGRALAFNDQGAAFTSLDHGATWTDVTVQVKSSPTKIEILEGELWLHESNNGASRLERDGHLAWFDKPPSVDTGDGHPKDPRWRGPESPLERAFHHGAAIDDRTALVIAGGDLVRIDVRTGDLVSVIPGRLPPDAICDAVPTGGDVLFACASFQGNGTTFVVSRTLGGDAPLLEQSFGDGGSFYASDDGGLAHLGSCSNAAAATNGGSVQSVCVRMPGGRWEERDLSGMSTDAGTSDVSVVRWVPRADGRVVAILGEPHAGIYDPESASFQGLSEEAKELIGRGPTYHPKAARIRHLKRGGAGSEIVDRSWSFVGSVLRGWQRQGEAVEIAEDGRLTRSAFTFETISSGALGLGRSKDGRLYQSNDHGGSWTEVAAPPAGVESSDMVACSSAGCDLGAFYRVGWATVPPSPSPPRAKAAPVAEVRRVRGLELSCRPGGAVVSKALPRTTDSPEDLGLGLARLPVANEKNEWAYVRNTLPRGITNPIRDVAGIGSDDSGTPSLRAIFSGFGTSRDGDVFTVSGPNKNALGLRRGFSFVAPLDPGGRILRTAIAMSDVVAAGKRAGMTNDEILGEDPTESGTVVVLTPADPAAASDVAIHNVERSLLSIIRGERVRVAIRSSQNSANVISGVALPNDETAFLEVDSSGVGHVFKVGSGGALAELFDVSPTANETYYPANPDALAVGPKGELAILRTPSGSDPASAFDPAFLIVQAMPPAALAPWSQLKLADDPACKAEPGGYRATLQTIAPWVRVTTPELRVEDAPMIARVRWTARRVCLEGFEVRLPVVNLRPPGVGNEALTVSSWLVVRHSSFARIAHGEGFEWRQPLECSVVTTGP